MTKVTAPYLIRKRGMFYLQKRVPTALVRHYGKEFIRKSLRTRDRVTAIRISSQLVSALEKEWSEKLFTMPDEMTATVFLSELKHTVPVLSAALSDYCTMKGRLESGWSGLDFVEGGAKDGWALRLGSTVYLIG